MTSLDDFFESYYRLRPVNATFTGVHEFDDRLPDWSPEGLQAAAAEMHELRRRLAAEGSVVIDDAAVAARDWDTIDRALADAFLEIQLSELESDHFQTMNPSLAIGEALFGVIALMTRPFADLESRMQRAAQRLSAFPAFLSGVARTWAAPGRPPMPAQWVARALRECDGGRRLITTGVDRWLESGNVPPSLVRDVRQAADGAANALLPFAQKLGGRGTADDGYAAGSDFLDLLLARGHCEPRRASDLFVEAQREFDTERRALDDMARSAAPGGWNEIRAKLADLHPEPDEYYGAFGETWRACRTLALRNHVLTWPEEWRLRYVPIPEWTRQAAPYLYYLYYRSPAPFDRVAIHDYVVPPIEDVADEQEEERLLRTWNDSVIKLNHVIHHGAIGHHVQNYYAYRAASRIAQVAAVDCASRIGMFCGGSLAEGWACYVSGVMEEIGFLSDFERVAEQHTRVRLLARAVLDLGLHTEQFSVAQGSAMLVQACGMTAEQAEAEVTKASMFPGTAMMYWIGMDGIRRLRSAHERSSGSRFVLRAFHDELLSLGALPVPLIARLMPAAPQVPA